jgi:gliding motility-associated-like protein
VTILNPLDNDSDINDPFGNLDPLSLSAVDGPFHGTVVLDEITGGFLYTPAPNYFGMDSLQYIVCDDGYPAPPECEKAWIVIEVVPEDDQPTINGTPTDVLDYCFGDLVLTPFVTVGEVDGDSLMAWVEIAVGYDASQDSLSYNGTLPSVWDPVTGTRSISASTAMELEASLRAVAYHNKRAPGGETGSERIFVAYTADWGGTLASSGDSIRLVIGSGNASICDADADGLADGMECPGGPDCNADLDDVPNYLDEDSDNDGIPDSHECGDPMACFDIDGDGTPDYLDTDSDNDGIPDYVEAGGPLPTGIDSDQDGIDDAWDYDAGGSGLTYLPSDTDGDGVHDFRDLDADNDGIADSFEAGADPFNPSDTDLDGLADYQDTDTDGDGIPDSVEADQPTASGVDTDRDGIDDSFDTDHGGSGLDTDPTDTDQDGVADFRDEDADNDGIADSYEAGDDPENPVDTDGDDVADYRDLDSDGDTIPDWVEADNPAATGNDADGDGIDDAYDTDANGSGLNTDPVDTDGDLVDDFRDLDTDGDGIPDSVEVGPNPEDPADTDGDGIADFRDLDSDGDGLLDNVDEGDGDCNGNGIPDWLDPETCDFMVVEVFTPNGDGFNDVFYVWGIFDHPDNELIVYNRWENVVYTRRGYDNSWDGSFQGNGEPLPDGTYYYVLKRNRNNSNSAVITGAVTIHR